MVAFRHLPPAIKPIQYNSMARTAAIALLFTPMITTESFNDRFLDRYAAGVFWLGILLLVAALIMLAVQILFFLKDGTWPDWVLTDVVYPFLPARIIRWLSSPQDWLGLHKIITTILLETPTFVGIIVLGVLCIKGPIKIGND